jgi:DNA-binding transcriptional regulator YdaS (Cro superfamily)
VRANLKTAIGVRFGSQVAFARAVGLHSVKVSRLCRGWIEPTLVERERIALALRADADWLFAVVRIPAPRSLSIEAATPTMACAGGE